MSWHGGALKANDRRHIEGVKLIELEPQVEVTVVVPFELKSDNLPPVADDQSLWYRRLAHIDGTLYD